MKVITHIIVLRDPRRGRVLAKVLVPEGPQQHEEAEKTALDTIVKTSHNAPDILPCGKTLRELGFTVVEHFSGNEVKYPELVRIWN